MTLFCGFPPHRQNVLIIASHYPQQAIGPKAANRGNSILSVLGKLYTIAVIVPVYLDWVKSLDGVSQLLATASSAIFYGDCTQYRAASCLDIVLGF